MHPHRAGQRRKEAKMVPKSSFVVRGGAE